MRCVWCRVALVTLSALSVTPSAPVRAAAPARGAARATAAATASPDSFAARVKGATRRDGLLATWLDRKAGKLFLELPKPSGPRGVCGAYIYVEGIRTGLGSNPVGLDRGQIGDARVVEFRRVGGRVLIEQPNLRYRARYTDEAEVRAVRESFATSVLWAGEILSEAADGRLLVDITSFLVRDAHRSVAALKAAGQGSFGLDRDRSALDPDQCRSFPDNLEFEALLTFTGEEAGREVQSTAPTAQAITLAQHHSLVRLPDEGYRPRAWDPRCGSFDVMFADYAMPIAADIDIRWIVRHRLEKVDPAAARSRAKKPIVYYVDPGVPEPIRSAVMDGASWWAKAFEAAGFVDAFRVELLPPDADPLDVRYNVIEWVHRSTRGWSYGGGVIDPRTGEMIKGHVNLGSLRVRQDRMIFEAMAGTERSGSGAPDDPVLLSLARIRQLSAHEVGHTLGFNHNFAASTYSGRASVMDYPAPLVRIRPDSTLDFSDAYAIGVGDWDVQTVRYAYTDFAPDVDERAGLAAILAENLARGFLYLADGDARPAGAAHPLAALWDNGEDPIAQLRHELNVRRIALRSFGERNIPLGTPLSTLRAVLAPLYFQHRYPIEAAAKSLGGLDYSYAVRGGGALPARPVGAARQREALAAVLSALDPVQLDLPDRLIAQLPPPSVDYPPHRELFGGHTAPAFDALGAAATAADLTLAPLLPPERLARLADFHRRDPGMPGVDEVLDAIRRQVFTAPAPAERRLQGIRRAVQHATVRRLLMAHADPRNASSVRASLEDALRGLAVDLGRKSRSGERADRAGAAMLAAEIDRVLGRPSAAAPPPATSPGAPPDPPPGPPIGMWSLEDDCAWR